MWNIKDKIVVISGATNGIGRAAAIEISTHRPKLFLTYRNQELVDSLVKDLKEKAPGISIETIHCDFSNQASIRKCASELNKVCNKIDILINNAGVVNTSYHETQEGIENTFAVNHLGYFLFTNLLLKNMMGVDEARVINVSSAAHSFVKEINWADINLKKDFGMGVTAYGQSKLANLLFTRYLAVKLSTNNISVNAIHPGGVNTALGGQNKSIIGKILKIILKPFFRSPLKGAETIIFLATKEDDGSTGNYFIDCKQAKSSSYSQNLEVAQRLWELSEELVNEKFLL